MESLFLTPQVRPQNITGGVDSRFVKFYKHLAEAKRRCNKKYSYDNVISQSFVGVAAAMNVGMGLHALQDITAHGDYPAPTVGGFIRKQLDIIHNSTSPQVKFGIAWHYPDDSSLDVVNSSDGIPRRSNFRIYDGSVYAVYTKGRLRYNKTEGHTRNALSDFKDFLKSRECSCACKKYFGFMDGQ